LGPRFEGVSVYLCICVSVYLCELRPCSLGASTITLAATTPAIQETASTETPDDVEKGVQMQEKNLDDLLGGDTEGR